MKNNKGISLISLSIYVIVATLLVGTLTFMNANFFSKISDMTTKTELESEYTKFISAFLKDLKNSSKVSEYSSTKLKFSNNASYEIRMIAGETAAENQYAIYRDSIKVCEGIVNSKDGNAPTFEYDLNENAVTISIRFADESYEWLENGTYRVGRGY